MSANRPLLELLEKFASERNATAAQVALAWMLNKYDFLAPIPGMRKEERVRENLGSAEITLSAEELAALENELANITIYGNRTDEDIMKLKYMT